MYQVVVYMPEDVPFNCRICCPQQPSPWQTLVQHEMHIGMKDVIDALLSSHSVVLLQPITRSVSIALVIIIIIIIIRAAEIND